MFREMLSWVMAFVKFSLGDWVKQTYKIIYEYASMLVSELWKGSRISCPVWIWAQLSIACARTTLALPKMNYGFGQTFKILVLAWHAPAGACLFLVLWESSINIPTQVSAWCRLSPPFHMIVPSIHRPSSIFTSVSSLCLNRFPFNIKGKAIRAQTKVCWRRCNFTPLSDLSPLLVNVAIQQAFAHKIWAAPPRAFELLARSPSLWLPWL